MTSDTEKQTLMGFAYDIRQSLKDSEYKELVELIVEKEQNKQKFVKITYRKVKVGDDEETGCIQLNYTLSHTTNTRGVRCLGTHKFHTPNSGGQGERAGGMDRGRK